MDTRELLQAQYENRQERPNTRADIAGAIDNWLFENEYQGIASIDRKTFTSTRAGRA